MFSCFNNGIQNTIPEKNIDLPALVRLIRQNPLKDKVEHIRYLRSIGDESYPDLKKELSYITPNCIVRKRCLEYESQDVNTNLKSFSQYIYFDMDGITDIESYKQYFINRYGNIVSLVCKSCSLGGLSVLIKVSNPITVDNFDWIRETLRNTYLQDEHVDESCSDIGRAMFISYDTDVYVNYENEVELDIKDIDSTRKSVKQCKTCRDNYFTLMYSFSGTPINEILKKINLKTPVEVCNPYIDFKPVDYLKIFIPKLIVDGKKHRTYTSIIHHIVSINPEISIEDLLSFLEYVNKNFAKPMMVEKELVRLVILVYTGIKEQGYSQVNAKTKYIHFNSNCNLSKSEKTVIANKMNGKFKSYNTINKIKSAIEQLELNGEKVTQRKVSKITGLSLSTVQRNFKKETIDMDKVIEEYNDPMKIEEFKNSNSQTKANSKDLLWSCRGNF